MADATNESTRTFDDMTAEQALELALANPKEWVHTALRTENVSASHLIELEECIFHGLKIALVNEEGGHEGEGEHAECTFAVRKGEQNIFYFEIQGHYDSYDGTDWNPDFYLVKPVQVMVTQYHGIE